MYKNWDKKTYRRYLIGAGLLFTVTALLSFALVFGISQRLGLDYVVWQKLVITFGTAVVPVASYTGFCVMFIRIDELSKKQMVLMTVFCVLVAVMSILVGVVMLIPTVFKAFSIKNT